MPTVFTFHRMTPEDDHPEYKPTQCRKDEVERREFLNRWELYKAILARAEKKRAKQEKSHD